jgi:hypothetical protein
LKIQNVNENLLNTNGKYRVQMMENYAIQMITYRIRMENIVVLENGKLSNTKQYKWKRSNIATFDKP